MSKKKPLEGETLDEKIKGNGSDADGAAEAETPDNQSGAAEPEAAPSKDNQGPELEALKENMLRLAAEYDNFRKRTARERESLHGNVKAETAAAFLPILDNLDRAAASPTADEAYAQGVIMIVKQFTEILAKLGVTEIEALGKPFDSNLHNAVMHVEQEDAGASVVVEVFQKGYMMGDRVLRHSVVKVAN